MSALAEVLLWAAGEPTPPGVSGDCSTVSSYRAELAARAIWASAPVGVHQWRQVVCTAPRAVASLGPSEAEARGRTKQLYNTLGNTTRVAGYQATAAKRAAPKGRQRLQAAGPIGGNPTPLKLMPPAAPLPPPPRGERHRLVEVELPRVEAALDAQTLLRGCRRVMPAYAPTDAAQQRQLATFQSWRLERLLERGQVGVFQPAPTRSAAADAAQTAQGAPPTAALRPHVHIGRTPSPRASPQGHLWMVTTAGTILPIRGRACEMIMGYDARDAGESMSGASGRGLTAARSSVTPSQWAALLGQAVHGGVGRLVAGRWVRSAVARRGSARVVTLGSGAGLWALSTAWELAGDPRLPPMSYVAYAELDERASRAHRALWSALSMQPTNLGPAHTQATVDSMPAADVVLASLCCSPFSPANRHRTEEAIGEALGEMSGALRAAVAGRPAIMIFENSGWVATAEGQDVRRRMGRILSAASEYSWTWALVSPCTHAGFPVHRERIFMVGRRYGEDT